MTAEAPTSTLRLLLVEDSMRDALLAREWLREVISDAQLRIVHVQTLTDALIRVVGEEWDCVLLDLDLPDSGGGVQNVQRMHAAAPDVAIVVISGNNDERTALEALRWGAQEYVIKGQFDGPSLLRVIQHALERNRVVTELNRQREHNYFHASHDGLTGLANRSLLLDRAREALMRAQRSGEKAALCFLDLDGFKPINDLHGHVFGDALLRAVAEILCDQVRDSDTVARIGGDEFVALLAPLRSADEAIRVANRIVQGIRAIDLVEGLPVKVGVSAGVALFPDDAAELESLMIRADAAMYIAKRHRNGGLCLSGESASVVVGGDADHLPAVPVHELALLFQPWMDLHRGVYHGAEAMVRRQESALYEVIGSLDPESGGAMEHLGDWIIEHAAAQWLAWAELKIAPTCVAISLTHSELAQPQLAERWLEILLRLGMSPSRLQVQVAEHICKEPAGSVIFENLRALRECGVRVVVAHFGREEASLTLLGRSPIDGVKLDKSLLHDLRSGKPEAHALVAAVLSVAHARGLDVIAAGIENEDDLRRCEDLNFPFAQGFWLSEPLPAKRLTTLLQDSVSARAVLEMTAQPAFAGSHAA